MATPAAGPNKRTEINTKVSETDSTADIDGILTLADPLKIVSAARISHWLFGGSTYIWCRDSRIMPMPAKMTAET